QDRRVVADVRRDTEDQDLVRVERREQRLEVRVRERAVGLLQQQDLPTVPHKGGNERRWIRRERQRQRVALRGLGDLRAPGRSPEAVRRERRLVVRLVGQLGVGQLVVVRRREVRDAALLGPTDETRHRGHGLLGVRHGQL